MDQFRFKHEARAGAGAVDKTTVGGGTSRVHMPHGGGGVSLAEQDARDSRLAPSHDGVWVLRWRAHGAPASHCAVPARVREEQGAASQRIGGYIGVGYSNNLMRSGLVWIWSGC